MRSNGRTALQFEENTNQSFTLEIHSDKDKDINTENLYAIILVEHFSRSKISWKTWLIMVNGWTKESQISKLIHFSFYTSISARSFTIWYLCNYTSKSNLNTFTWLSRR